MDKPNTVSLILRLWMFRLNDKIVSKCKQMKGKKILFR